MKKIRIAFVEDNKEYVEAVVEPVRTRRDLEVTGIYPTASSAIQGIEKQQPEIVLIDLGLPDKSGTEVISYFCSQNAPQEFIVLTIYDDDQHLFSAFQAGALGYILKDSTSTTDLIDAIVDLKKGGSPMSMGIARRIVESFKKTDKIPKEYFDKLTPKELKVLESLTKGYSAKKIGRMFDIAYSTVRVHQRNIYRKLQVNSALEAVTLYKCY